MSRIVRSSKYRHVFGTPYKKDKCYDNIRITKAPWESNMSSVNKKFLAVVMESQGGGSFLVLPLDKPGRIDINYPKVSGHRSLVLDVAWDPFDDNIIASSSEDCLVKIWTIPDGGLKENLQDCTMELIGHERKVGIVVWHPCAKDVLASGDSDSNVLIWNVATGENMISLSLGERGKGINSLSWNFDGSLLAATSKDKMLRILDPRKEGEIFSEGVCHQGTKATKVTFCGDMGLVATTGFSHGGSGERQVSVWDQRDLSKPVSTQNIDNASGVNIPFFDNGTKMLYLVGKGDTQIRYFEVVKDPPNCFFLNMYMSSEPQRGACCMPKKDLNHMDCEVFRLYKMTNKNMIEPLSMTVPRKSGMFQEDLFPPCAAGEPSLTAHEWFDGANKPPKMVTITSDGLGSVQDAHVTSPVKPSYGHLSKQSSHSSCSSTDTPRHQRTTSPEAERPSSSLSGSGEHSAQLAEENRHLKHEIQGLKKELKEVEKLLKESEDKLKRVRQIVN